jgi:LuxR family transcriptional regulator, maltose regulon positive regulatory protein
VVGPLLSSKYRLPIRRPGVVPRRRLAERVAAATQAPLTLLSAPAGFGKTTLLAEWLAEAATNGAAVAWLSLDRRDNDPVLFWTYVVTAMRAAAPGLGDAALQLLASSPSDSSSNDAALAVLLNEVEGLSTNLVLALDDYHVIDTPEVHEGIQFVLEHQPAQLHLILATRSDPPLPLGQLRARRQLVEVRAADLRFTTAEAALYLNDSMGLELSDENVAVLKGRTEGWIAALQLAALSLQGRADASAFIAGFAGEDHYVVDYLVEEVLARQPDDVRGFLLQTSILESLTGPLCDAVTGRQGGKAALVALERANLFLVPLDDRRQWYRYHQLFADVLHAHLLDERPHELAGLHRRASAWFDAHGDTSQAISHALAGGNTGRAADLMELAMPRMRRERREADLARWMQGLPEDVLRTRPVLAVAFVGALTQALKFDTVAERLDEVEALVRTADGTWPEQPPPQVIVVDQDNYRSLPAHIQMYRAAFALASGDLAGTITHAREALVLAPPHDPVARSAAGALAGLASWSTGDLSGAHAAYTESVAGLTSAGFLADVLGCTITLGDLRRTQGQLTAAVRTYQRALDLAESTADAEPLRGTADMHVGLAGVLLERNDLTGALEQLTISRQLGDHNGLPQNAYRWRVVLARLRAAEGDLDDALRLLDEAERVYVGDFAPNVQPVPAVRSRLRIRREELADAQEWADERQLSSDDAPSYLREYEHLTLARLLIAHHRAEPDAGDIADVLALLNRLLAAAQSGGRAASVIEVLMLQAAAHDACGNSLPALAALRHAVTLAQPEGYVRLFTDEGAPMAALLKVLRKRPAAPTYVNRLIASTTTLAARTALHQQLVEPLSERELDVLRLLGGDLGGPDIARQLSVSLNTLRTHTKNIYAKLGVASRRAAVRQARELNLIPGGQGRGGQGHGGQGHS